jgi:hypothetical protein
MCLGRVSLESREGGWKPQDENLSVDSLRIDCALEDVADALDGDVAVVPARERDEEAEEGWIVLRIYRLDNFSIGATTDDPLNLISVRNVPAVKHRLPASIQIHRRDTFRAICWCGQVTKISVIF